MPLSEKTRIEVYLPDLPLPSYQKLLESLRREFTYAFGGSTHVRGMSGTYLSRLGLIVEDRVNLLYADAALEYEADADLIDRYAEAPGGLRFVRWMRRRFWSPFFEFAIQESCKQAIS